jgi:hypothetical protein
MRPVLVAVAAALTLAGCNPDSVSFQATNVTAVTGSGGINLNDEIGIRFNQELDPASISAESLRVTDGNGRRLAIRARAANDIAYVSPADPDGWPVEARLVVEVPHPWLGRPIRSAIGVANEAPFRTEVTTNGRYAARGGTLKLLSHSLPFSDGTDVIETAEFTFEFDGPLDKTSLAEGITLEDLTHGETAPHFASEVVSRRRLSIVPFADPLSFRSGTQYRLTLTAALRAQDHRKLGEALSFVFTTARSRSGEHTTDFRPEHLVDPSLKPEKGPLTPLFDTTKLDLVQGSVPSQQPSPFGRERSKIQILIPKGLLFTPEELENALITGMSFRVFGAEPAALRLSARLDYAAAGSSDGLGRAFEENWNLPATRERDLIGAEGEVHVLDPSDGTITFAFPRPFFYDAREGRSLILEIVNESGILNESAGIEIRGAQDPGSFRFVEARGNWAEEGQQHSFVPALSFSIQRLRRVPLKPWKAETVTDPEYFRRRVVVATPGFVDYQVEYRSFDTSTDPNAPGGWKTDLSELDGHRSIQARIFFPLRSADPLPKGAGLLRLTVPFRQRGTE